MAEFIHALDPSKLVLAETVLSFAISPFSSPSYNLPIFLFGIYAQENQEAVLSLQVFSSLVGVSMIFDIIWLSQNEQNWFLKLFSALILVLKVPTFLAFGSALRARGAQFSGLGVGGDLGGPTVWSMPGGFSGGRDGYQTVDEREPQTARPPPPPAPGPINQPAAPGAYQTV
ncbi:hypothetical protein EWM64_g4862 [Hericium alpestre]|uniref:Uncharacterized protein n=1 Tax=Hericium alpestre TaxID=135208 RepID=A0A4Z0A038_9AGAM|nr:hypothetical protein EWM64_g4862 [Hericium alpestre]